MHMTSRLSTTGKYDVIANDTVVCDVGVIHKEVIRTNASHAFVLHCATVHCAVFTEHVIVTNNQLRRFTFVFFVLTIFTYAGELVKMIAFAQHGWAFQHHMRFKYSVIANHHVRSEEHTSELQSQSNLV